MTKKKRATKSRRAAKSDFDYAPILLAGGAGLAVYFLTRKKGAGGDAAARLRDLQTQLEALQESIRAEFLEMNAKMNTAVAAGIAVEDAEMTREQENMRVKEIKWKELTDEMITIIEDWPPPAPEAPPTLPEFLSGEGWIPDWLRATMATAAVGTALILLYKYFSNRINKGGGKPPSVNCSICGGTISAADWDEMDQTLQAHLMAYHPVNIGNALAVLPGVRAGLYSLPYWAQGVAASEANMAYFYSQPVEYWGTSIQDNPWVLYALLSILTLMLASPAMLALIPAATATKVAQTAQELGYAFAPAG